MAGLPDCIGPGVLSALLRIQNHWRCQDHPAVQVKNSWDKLHTDPLEGIGAFIWDTGDLEQWGKQLHIHRHIAARGMTERREVASLLNGVSRVPACKDEAYDDKGALGG